MARIHTYENDEVVRGGDKWIGSDAQSLNKTKNFTADKVAEYYALNGVMLSPNAVTLKYKEWQNPSGTPSGFFWSFTPVNDLVNVNSVSSFGMSKKDLKVRFFDELLNSFEGHFVFFYNAVSPNNFAIFKLTGIQDHPDNANLFKIDVQFIDGNGSFTFEDSFFFGLLDRSVNYDDIDGIPTNLSEFTNDVGFITVDDLPNTLLTATQFNSNHTSGLGNGYLAGDVVYYQGRIYKAKFNNDAVLPSVGGNTYWDDLGVGERLRQVNADWNSTSGDSLILNKPTIPTQTSDLTNNGEDGVNPFITAADVPVSNLQGVLDSGSSASFNDPSTGESVLYNIPDYDGLTYGTSISHSDSNNNSVLSVTSSGVYASSAKTSGTEYYSIQLTCPSPIPTANEYNNVLNLFSSDNPNEGFYGVLVPTPNFTQNTGIYFPIKPTGDYTLATTDDIPSITGYVPYTGATQNVDLGEYELKAGQVTLDTSPTGTAAVGTTQWNNSIGSSETTLKGGSVVLKNGVDLVARVVNKVTPNTTLTKANYPAVRVSGAQGQRLAVAYAQANNDSNSADTIGLVCETIATNQEGFILTVGQLEDINTTGSLQGETWADGDVIYLSPTTAGALTNIKPTGATGHIVVIGYVEYAHAIHGKLYVKVMNGWELDELHNVNISSPTNNQILAYTSSTQLWENKSVVTALGYTPENVSNKQTDLTASSTKYPTVDAVNTGLGTKQNTLVSGTNIKTINSTTILGSGNISVEPVITAGTTAQYYRGDKTFQTLDKSAVGLGNVDNTSDANKPISTATQTALNAKQDSLVSGTNIKTLDGLNTLGSGDLEYFNNTMFEQNIGYMIPIVGGGIYTTLRSTTSIVQLGQTADFNVPSRMLYASSTTVGSLCFQRGTQGGSFVLSSTNKIYFKRRFQIDSNVSGSRFVCGLSNQFSLANPTNVEPDTLINTIGVCKLSTSNNLYFFWNDATGLATTVDLGVNYPANNVTAYTYDLEIFKDSGTANITLKLTRIDASGNRISTSQVISSNYNTGVNYAAIYGTNNATAASFRFFDFGIIFKNYNSQWNTI